MKFIFQNILVFIFFTSIANSQNVFIEDYGLRNSLQFQFPNFFVHDSLVLDSAQQNNFQNQLTNKRNHIFISSNWNVEDINEIKYFKKVKELEILFPLSTNADSLALLDSLEHLILFGDSLIKFPDFSNLIKLKSLKMDWFEKRFPNFQNNVNLKRISIDIFSFDSDDRSIDSIPLINYSNNIRVLNLGQGIKYFPPQPNLSQLTSLSLCCKLNEIDVSGYPNLDSLLIFGNNNLIYPLELDIETTIQNDQFGLRSIDVSNNNLLKSVFLPSNFLKQIDLSNVGSVTDIVLYNNLLKEISYPNNLTQLKRLYLFNNKIQELPDLGNSCLIEELYLSNNHIKFFPPICPSADLKNIDLENNLLTEISNFNYINFNDIVSINIKENKLDFSDVEEIIFLDSILYLKSLNNPSVAFSFFPQKPFGIKDTFDFSQKTDTFISIKSQEYAHSYQWYKNGEIISGATDTILYFYRVQKKDAGKYECKSYGNALNNLHFNNATEEFISEPKYVYINNENIESPQLLVYPNPIKTFFNLKFYTNEDNNNVSFELFNCIGKKVFTSSLLIENRGLHNEIIDKKTLNLNSGLYFLNFKENGNLIQTEKLIIID